jgi:hypothetical protein
LSTDGDLLVFAREDEASGDVVIVAANRGTDAAATAVPLPERWRGLAVREALSGAPVTPEDGRVAINTPARTAQVFVTEKGTTGAIIWRASGSRT